jgi:hypothetical protein
MMDTVENKTPFAIGDAVNEVLRAEQILNVNCQCAGALVVLRGTVADLQAWQKVIELTRRVCGMREVAFEINIAS